MKHQIFTEYDDELKGLTNFLWVWHNSNNNETDHNNWNFTTPWLWDNVNNPKNMWYDERTSRLARTVKYKIGYDSIDKMNV